MHIHEIFTSISGEQGPLYPQGTPVTFVRFQGCNLRCNFCDTPKTQEVNPTMSGMSDEELFETVTGLGYKNVLITGGEPLLQKAAVTTLCRALLTKGYKIQIETNGSIPPRLLNNPYEHLDNPLWTTNIGMVVDVKPASTQQHKSMLGIHALINSTYVHTTMLKYMVRTANDLKVAAEHLQKAREVHRTLAGDRKLYAALSVVGDALQDKFQYKYFALSMPSVIEWMADCMPDTVLNVQLHKYIGVA